MIQNHLLQVLAIAGDGGARRARSEALRDEKARLLEVDRPADVQRTSCAASFAGYRDEHGVAPDSTVETFAAVRLHVDTWRWAGVPFLIRAGKCLPVTATEVLVELRRPPQIVFDEPPPGAPNSFRFALSPDV